MTKKEKSKSKTETKIYALLSPSGNVAAKVRAKSSHEALEKYTKDMGAHNLIVSPDDNEFAESYKNGDIPETDNEMYKMIDKKKKPSIEVGHYVIPKVGPHKGQIHKVIHVKADGSVNITPTGIKSKDNKYRLGAAHARLDQLSSTHKTYEDAVAKNKKNNGINEGAADSVLYIAKFEKDGKKFSLWRKGKNLYELTYSSWGNNRDSLRHVLDLSTSIGDALLSLKNQGYKMIKSEVKESIDPSELIDEPISFNRKVSGKYKATTPVQGRKVKGTYGTSYTGDDENKETQPEVKRGRGRPRKNAEVTKWKFPELLTPKVKEPKKSMALIKARRKVTMEEIELNEKVTEGQPGKHVDSKYKYLGKHKLGHVFQDEDGKKEIYQRRSTPPASWHLKHGNAYYEFVSSNLNEADEGEYDLIEGKINDSRYSEMEKRADKRANELEKDGHHVYMVHTFKHRGTGNLKTQLLIRKSDGSKTVENIHEADNYKVSGKKMTGHGGELSWKEISNGVKTGCIPPSEEDRKLNKHLLGKGARLSTRQQKAIFFKGKTPVGANERAYAKRTANWCREDVNDVNISNELNEVLSADATAGDWIHDFVHSNNPKFKGKSKEERIKMALGAYYSAKKQNEEVDLVEGFFHDVSIVADRLGLTTDSKKHSHVKNNLNDYKKLADQANEISNYFTANVRRSIKTKIAELNHHLSKHEKYPDTISHGVKAYDALQNVHKEIKYYKQGGDKLRLRKPKMTNEETELNELNKNTLANYIDKAAVNVKTSTSLSRQFDDDYFKALHLANKHHPNVINNVDKDPEVLDKANREMKTAKELSDTFKKQANKRIKGIQTATKKLTKEETEVGELLEISKALLGRYIKQATSDYAMEYAKNVEQQNKSDEIDRFTNRLNVANKEDTKKMLAKAFGATTTDQQRSIDRRYRRFAGISTAVNKLTREEVELNEVKKEYHPSHPYGLRHKAFTGKEKRLTTVETWHKTYQDRNKYINRLESKDGNFYEIESTCDPRLNEQSMAAMGRHAEREWHDELSSKSGQGNAKNRYHLRRNGQHVSSHATEKDAMDAWSKHPNQRGIKIVHEDVTGNEYEYGVSAYQDGIMYKYEVTLDGDIIKEGRSVTLAGAETMATRYTLQIMETIENNTIDKIGSVDSVLTISKSMAKNKE